MRILGKTVFLILFCLFTHQPAVSQQLVTNDVVVSTYEHVAFENAEKALKKFGSQPQYKLNLVCLAGCDETALQLKRFMAAARFPIQTASEYDKSASINIIFLGDDVSAENRALMEKDVSALAAGESVFRESYADCTSLTIASDTEIKRIVILARNSPSWKRNVSCSLLQLMRGSRLKLQLTFEELWTSQTGFTYMEQKKFNAIMALYGKIVALHFLPQTRSGMKQSDFRQAIVKLSAAELFGGCKVAYIAVAYSTVITQSTP
jgi:hypothetical protein